MYGKLVHPALMTKLLESFSAPLNSRLDGKHDTLQFWQPLAVYVSDSQYSDYFKATCSTY